MGLTDRARTMAKFCSVVLLSFSCFLVSAVGAEPYPYQDPAKPLDARVQDLLSRLTLDEKISLFHQYQPAISRLGVPAFRTGTEALHGVAWLGQATVFPQALGMASTWDVELIERVGNAVGDEARGFNSVKPDYNGLNLWAPVVNLLRDPRWGRNEEGYSEDPHLTGAISVAYCKGLIGNDPKYIKTAPTLKHFFAYNNEIRRDTTSSSVSPRVMYEYDLKAFQPAIAANVATGMMASYNLVNGRPNHVSPYINEIARKWTNNEILVVSDAYGPYNLTGSEAYFATQPEADAAAIKAGLDSFTIDDADSSKMITAIKSAVSSGLLTEADLDKNLRHILSVRFRLGDFDPAGANPYAKITSAVINSPEHQKLARKTADAAMVLLKNNKSTLPLDAAKIKRIAVVGPLINTLYEDWYSGTMPYKITPLAGIQERLGAKVEVVSTEAVDRIALKDVASGLYVSASTDSAGATLTASADSAGSAQSFDVFDWGEGVVTLRAAANGKFVTRSWSGGVLVNSEAQPNGWYVMQQFKLAPQADGTFVLEYGGYELRESWYGNSRYVVVGSDGQLSVTSSTIETASRFSKEILSSSLQNVIEAARAADAVVAVVGSMPFINGRENRDRNDINLPEAQSAVIKAAMSVNPRTIVVLENSYPTAINWENANVPAILWTTHAGQETGHAVADVIFGDYSPSGRLTQTWYRTTDGLADILDYDIIGSRETYQYFDRAPLYPFGYGLSYTTFAYKNLMLSTLAAGPGSKVVVTLDVTNTGGRQSDEVVQLYSSQRVSRTIQPIKTLRAFSKIHDVRPGETRKVRFELNLKDFEFWDVTRSRSVLEMSVHDIQVGSSSADIRGVAPLVALGEVIPPRDLTRLTRAESYDLSQGIRLADESKVRGVAVESLSAGDWVVFQGVDLKPGVTGITAQIAREASTSSSIELRLDSPHGPVIGSANVPSTGSRYTYTAAVGVVHGAVGKHNLYLVFAGGGTRLSTFKLVEGRGPVK